MIRGRLDVVVTSSDFSRFYDEEHPRVYGSMLALCGDPEVAADITADAFAKALVSWRRVAPMERPGGWVYKVALNMMRRRFRRRSREREIYAATFHEVEQVTGAPDVTGLDVWVHVRALPNRQRHAIVLRYVADLTEPEIAGVLGVSRGTVASNLADARRSLAAQLGPVFGAESLVDSGSAPPTEARSGAAAADPKEVGR
jgi:RNA polymerase sigma factor (sigma-70 family)